MENELMGERAAKVGRRGFFGRAFGGFLAAVGLGRVAAAETPWPQYINGRLSPMWEEYFRAQDALVEVEPHSEEVRLYPEDLEWIRGQAKTLSPGCVSSMIRTNGEAVVAFRRLDGSIEVIQGQAVGA